MTKLSPKALATKIAKESNGVSIKFGRTNGRDVLHLVRKRDDEKGRKASSVTIIADLTTWQLHPWNTGLSR